MSANQLLVLQSAGVFLQMVNAQIGVVTRSASLAAIVGAAIGAFQYYVQHCGNQSEPEKH